MSLVLDIIIPEASQVPEENGDQLWVGRNFAEAEEVDPEVTGQFAQGQFAQGQFAQKFEFFF